MKKFYINLDESKETREITLSGHDTFTTAEGEHKYEYKFLTPSVMVLRIDGNNYVIKCETDTESDSEIKNTDFILELNGNNYKLTCKSELDLLLEKFSKTKSDKGFRKDILSPMPGSIVKINVREGDKVRKGQVLLVLEAMKMENELKAAQDCIVNKVLAEEKKPVDKGQILLKLEPFE
jgi:biotin carboxyl carrier protein